MSREEALKKIKAEIRMYDEESHESVEWEECYEALKQELEQAKWIPCSEGLPEESGKYLVTFGGIHLVGIDFYNTEEDARRDFEEPEEYVGWSSHNVVAWMSHPEPYKAESEVKE